MTAQSRYRPPGTSAGSCGGFIASLTQSHVIEPTAARKAFNTEKNRRVHEVSRRKICCASRRAKLDACAKRHKSLLLRVLSVFSVFSVLDSYLRAYETRDTPNNRRETRIGRVRFHIESNRLIGHK